MRRDSDRSEGPRLTRRTFFGLILPALVLANGTSLIDAPTALARPAVDPHNRSEINSPSENPDRSELEKLGFKLTTLHGTEQLGLCLPAGNCAEIPREWSGEALSVFATAARDLPGRFFPANTPGAERITVVLGRDFGITDKRPEFRRQFEVPHDAMTSDRYTDAFRAIVEGLAAANLGVDYTIMHRGKGQEIVMKGDVLDRVIEALGGGYLSAPPYNSEGLSSRLLTPPIGDFASRIGLAMEHYPLELVLLAAGEYAHGIERFLRNLNGVLPGKGSELYQIIREDIFAGREYSNL